MSEQVLASISSGPSITKKENYLATNPLPPLLNTDTGRLHTFTVPSIIYLVDHEKSLRKPTDPDGHPEIPLELQALKSMKVDDENGGVGLLDTDKFLTILDVFANHAQGPFNVRDDSRHRWRCLVVIKNDEKPAEREVLSATNVERTLAAMKSQFGAEKKALRFMVFLVEAELDANKTRSRNFYLRHGPPIQVPF